VRRWSFSVGAGGPFLARFRAFVRAGFNATARVWTSARCSRTGHASPRAVRLPYPRDLTEPHEVETGTTALADEVWDWCETNRWFGRTVTVKLRYADFRTITRSRTWAGPVASRAELATISLELMRDVFPLAKPVRLLGVTVSTLDAMESRDPAQPSFDFGQPDEITS
jgi:nucleotidyltransferase/DNA polymerase involved in DNA repair